MPQVDIRPDQVRDPWEKNLPGLGVGRDGCRTPMQWDSTPQAGFSNGAPWLPLSPNSASENVMTQRRDATSMLSLYKALIALRRLRPELALGTYKPVSAADDLLVFEREHQGQQSLVALNFGREPRSLETNSLRGRIQLSTFMDRQDEVVDGRLALKGSL